MDRTMLMLFDDQGPYGIQPNIDLSPEDEREIKAAREAVKVLRDKVQLSEYQEAEKRCYETIEGITQKRISPYQDFLVNDLGSPEAAKKEVARIKDIQQHDALAWSRFTFQGHAKGLATIKKLLP